MYLKNIIFVLCSLLFASLLTACKPKQRQIEGNTMGTYYSIKYVAAPSIPAPAEVQAGINARLALINRQMSTYRPDSEISRFNASREVNVPFHVSPATVKVVNEAIRIGGLTDNALDITVGPLVNLWGFGPETGPEGAIPSADDIRQRLSQTGLEKLKVQGQALVKTVPQLAIDLSSIAKGYGVDEVADYLQSQGIHNYLVDIGGEVRAKGKNHQGRLWRIAIEKPLAGLEQSVQRVIELNDMAIATSGDYRNYFDANGKRYSHTIDPKTGYPIQNGIASITVMAQNCMMADGFSTGLGVVGPKRAIEIADRLNLAVFIIVKTDRGFEERYSRAFKQYLVN